MYIWNVKLHQEWVKKGFRKWDRVSQSLGHFCNNKKIGGADTKISCASHKVLKKVFDRFARKCF